MTESDSAIRTVDLDAAADELLAEAAASDARRASRSLLHRDVQRAVLIALSRGAELSEHESPPSATFHVVRGRARLHSDDEEWVVEAGEWVPIPSDRHAVDALTDCVILLTVSLGR